MKKAVFTISFLAVAFTLIAGGIVHNTNQSASFIRMPARNAVLGIDAVYFNPAATSLLKDGFHFSVNNQYITQTRTIRSTFPTLGRTEFEGGVVAPVFPSVFGVYKTNNWAFSLALMPIGGGGSATFEKGLPSFEAQPSTLPSALSLAGVPTTAYSLDAHFEGRSLIWGLQAGVAYQANDVVSIGAGIRYLTINNSYHGHLRDIQINPVFPALGFTGDMVAAPTFFTAMAGMFNSLAGTAASLQPLITGGGGGLTLAQAQAMQLLTAEQVQAIGGGVGFINPALDPTTMTIEQIQGAYQLATPVFLDRKVQAEASAAATGNRSLDVSQSGTGWAPFIGFNINLTDNFNVAVKYEHRARINVTNETTTDDVGLYPDGEVIPSDMPSMFSLGASWAPIDKLRFYAGYHHYLDKQANYGRKINNVFVDNSEVIDNNFWEAAFGFEAEVTDRLMISAGYLHTQTGVNKFYQSDLTHSLSTNSLGTGVRFKLNESFALNFGVMNTTYVDDYRMLTGALGAFQETYNRSANVIALGVDMSF